MICLEAGKEVDLCHRQRISGAAGPQLVRVVEVGGGREKGGLQFRD